MKINRMKMNDKIKTNSKNKIKMFKKIQNSIQNLKKISKKVKSLHKLKLKILSLLNDQLFILFKILYFLIISLIFMKKFKTTC